MVMIYVSDEGFEAPIVDSEDVSSLRHTRQRLQQGTPPYEKHSRVGTISCRRQEH